MPCCGTGLGLPYGGTGVDRDALLYFNRASITDPTAKQQIIDFVKGVKSLGLWNNFVCWPLRSSQNRGQLSIAYSLGGLGTYNGTLSAGVSWGANGVTVQGSSDAYIINSSYPVVTSDFSCFGVTTVALSGSSGGFVNIATTGGTNGLAGRFNSYAFSRPSSCENGSRADNLTSGSRVQVGTDIQYNQIRWKASSFAFDLSNFLSILDASVSSQGSASGTAALPFTDSNTGLWLLKTQITGVTQLSPFVGVYKGFLSNTDHQNIRNLYKSTLGSGLALS